MSAGSTAADIIQALAWPSVVTGFGVYFIRTTQKWWSSEDQGGLRERLAQHADRWIAQLVEARFQRARGALTVGPVSVDVEFHYPPEFTPEGSTEAASSLADDFLETIDPAADEDSSERR